MTSLCAATESADSHGSEMRTQPVPEFPCSGAWRCLNATRQGSPSGARPREITLTPWKHQSTDYTFLGKYSSVSVLLWICTDGALCFPNKESSDASLFSSSITHPSSLTGVCHCLIFTLMTTLSYRHTPPSLSHFPPVGVPSIIHNPVI